MYFRHLLVGSDNVARYYHYDGTGHVRAITDSTGAVVERYDYDAFGALRNTPTGLSNDRRFTAEQFDAETAYTFLRARYYDPALGRFISKDSFKGVKNDPQTLNRYVYTANNPVNRTDPSGKCFMACLALVPLGWQVSGLALAAMTSYVMVEMDAGHAIADWAKATWDELTTLWSEDSTGSDPESLRHTPDQEALVELAKEARRAGVTNEEAGILEEWADEMGLPFRGPEEHPNRNYKDKHIHLGPINHIPVVEP